jgi:RecA-family ATPase
MTVDDDTLGELYEDAFKTSQAPPASFSNNGHGQSEPPPAFPYDGEVEELANGQPEDPPAPTPTRRQRWSVAELLDTEFPEPRWAIPGLIPEGLTLFGGRPKVGKSWLMLQAAISVGTGGVFFGQRVERGNVLFVALEDGPRRLQDRIKKMRIPRNALITFERTWKPLQRAGLADLVIELEAMSYRLVVFDTLTRAFPGLDQNEQHIISKIMGDIQALAVNRNTAIVFNDHTRKPNSFDSDPIDDIMNSTVKTAAADCILALYKVKGKFNLKGRGRDVEEIDYSIRWDPVTWCWQNEGSAGELRSTEQETKILEALRMLGKCQCNDISKAINEDRSNTYRRLEALWSSGKVHREGINRNVYYELVQQ